ncbi:MAG: transcription termination/antitermination protein NusG [Candidatus Margulisiibacteriota bacterium]
MEDQKPENIENINDPVGPAAEEPVNPPQVNEEPQQTPAKPAEPVEQQDQPEQAEEEPTIPEYVPKEESNEPVEKRWYVIQTYSGQEDRVKQAIENNIDQLNMRHKISQVLIPEEEVVELKGTKRVEKIRKMYPGYVFLEMILDDESWYAIRQTPGVARFIGTKVKPTPVLDREMQRVLKQIGVKGEKLEVAFSRGESVRVISGPFRGYTGTVDEINADKEKLKVLINIFGRDTPVEVNFEHAEKIV